MHGHALTFGDVAHDRVAGNGFAAVGELYEQIAYALYAYGVAAVALAAGRFARCADSQFGNLNRL